MIRVQLNLIGNLGHPNQQVRLMAESGCPWQGWEDVPLKRRVRRGARRLGSDVTTESSNLESSPICHCEPESCPYPTMPLRMHNRNGSVREVYSFSTFLSPGFLAMWEVFRDQHFSVNQDLQGQKNFSIYILAGAGRTMAISVPSTVSHDRASWELLRAIARAPASVDVDRIRLLAQEVQNGEALVDLAEEHGVSSMLFSRLEDLGSAIPQLRRLEASYAKNAFSSLANAAELISLLEVFDQEKIPAMPFKGVVLAASVYHDLTTRPAGDLDILICCADVQRAATILLKQGYTLLTATQVDGMARPRDGYEYHFERQSDGMIVELHLSLYLPKFKRELGMDWIWPQRRTVLLAGAEVPNMSPETTLLVLCMHGTKHTWSRLIWICDVARLLDSVPGLDWQEVAREAQKTGLQRCLALGVLLAHRIAGCSLPGALLQRFESDATAGRLARHIEENLFNAPGSRPRGRLPYCIQVLDIPDRIRLLLSLDLLRPNERDQAVLPLPTFLHPLHYLLRPFRILWDRSAR